MADKNEEKSTDEEKPVEEQAKAAPDAAGKPKEDAASQEKKPAKRAGKKPAPAAPKASAHAGATLPTPAWVAIAVVALVVGVLAGHFLLGGSSISLSGKTTLTGDQLDSTIATYTYNGKTVDVTARNVIAQSKSVDSAANDDGTYNVPVADDVVSYARNAIVLQAAKDKGLTVSDDELSDYANKMFNTDDYSTIASNYGIDEDTAKQTISDSCLMSKLRDSVVTATVPEQPTKPDAPADGAEDTPTADYAAYIINLAGDEWDSANNTWARTDGDYYNALSSYEITNDSATYAAAQAAYYVAYSNYSSAYSDYSSQWTTYVNSLLSNATIQLGSLAV